MVETKMSTQKTMTGFEGMLEMKVSAQKSASFYVRAARKLFEQGTTEEGKPIVELRVSGLGDAVGLAITVAANLEACGVGQLVRTETGYQTMSNQRKCVSVLIQVMRVDRFCAASLSAGLPTALGRVLLARAAPKVELHVHLDGTLDYQTMFEAAQRVRGDLPSERVCPWEDPISKQKSIVRPKSELGECKNLTDFKKMVTAKAMGLYPILEVFYRYLPVVQGRNALLEEVAYQFCEFQRRSNVIYTEVRYSPHEFFSEEHKENPPEGMAKAVVESISKGLARGQQACGITVKQILCCINFSPQWSMDTVKTAAACKDLGVVGVDIASGEHHFDIDALHQAHKAAMDIAHKEGLPITVHAGEDGGAANCTKAVDVYHAKRLGHGYHLLDDAAAYKRLKDLGIHLECCPTSSVWTKAVSGSQDWDKHPICSFVRDGMNIGLNTDDPLVFDIDLNTEIDMAVARMGLSLEDIRTCTNNSINAAFCDEALKTDIRKQVDAWYAASLHNP
jgi:adenosine deaminase